MQLLLLQFDIFFFYEVALCHITKLLFVSILRQILCKNFTLKLKLTQYVTVLFIVVVYRLGKVYAEKLIPYVQLYPIDWLRFYDVCRKSYATVLVLVHYEQIELALTHSKEHTKSLPMLHSATSSRFTLHRTLKQERNF